LINILAKHKKLAKDIKYNSMKNLILLITVALFSTKLLSQDFTYFFQNLPDEVFFGVSKENRKKIAESDTSIQIDEFTYSLRVEDKRAYFYCSAAEEGISFSYWDISNGNNLIVIWDYSDGPPSYNDNLSFYYYNGNDFTLLDWSDVMSEEISINNFFSNNPEQNIKRMSEDLHFLPGEHFNKEGMNLVLSWGVYDKEMFKKYGIIGNKMELIWNDGKFTKGKVYWSKR
jgi:hypothetical protein